nr:MAG TPA: hypothetical protein [Caudoviricetes sp.]
MVTPHPSPTAVRGDLYFQTPDEGSGLFVSLTTHLLLSSSSHERSTSVFWG